MVSLTHQRDAPVASAHHVLLDAVVRAVELPLWERPQALDALLMTRPEVELLADALVAWA